MEIQEFLTETAKGEIPIVTLTQIAADRRAFGDDVLAAFTTQVQIRSTAGQTLLDVAQAANRDLLASEQRTFDGAIRERDSILGLLRQVEQRTAGAYIVPASQTVEQRTTDANLSPVLGKEQRCVEYVRARGGVPYVGEAGADRMSAWRVFGALATGNRRGLSPIELRALSEGTLADGGYAVPEVLGAQVLDAVFNRMVVRTAGAQIVPMTSETLNLARVAQPGIYDGSVSPVAAGAQWKTENDDITEGSLTLERVQLQAKTLPMLLTMSVELSEDAQGLDAAIERAMSSQIAVEFDRVALNGSGTPPEPKGIRNQTGVTIDSTAHNTTTSFDFMVDGMATLWDDNHEPNAIIYGPTIAAALAKLKDQQDQPLRAPDVLANVPKYRTKQATTHQIFYGDFSQLLVGVRTGFRLEVSRTAGTAFGKLQIAIRAYMRGDIAVARPEAFLVQTNVG